MRFVEIQDPVEYTSIEVRIVSPNDLNLFLVVKSFKVSKDDIEERKIERAMFELDQLRSAGFEASIWRVSKAVVNDRLDH